MNKFAHRRLMNIFWVLVIGGGLTWLTLLYEMSLRDGNFLTGWVLVGCLAFLLAYNLRKKIHFLPLISASVWQQAHVYCGWLFAIVFLLHTGFRLPIGGLETALWWLTVMILLTGAVGIALTRLLPERALHHGERVIFERIPGYRAELAREVEELVARSLTETSSSTITAFYVNTLQPYFAKPQNLWSHICQSSAPKVRMEQEFRVRRTYLNDEAKQILAQIESRVHAAENLDYQYAMQLLLKGWLFVHVPLSYAIVLIVACHVVLVYVFAGASR